MLIRLAFFEGTLWAGREAEFDAYVEHKLAPLWRRMPHARRVEILRAREADAGSPSYPLVLQIAYPDRAALDEALASPVRAESREATKGVYEFFEGRIFHIVYEA